MMQNYFDFLKHSVTKVLTMDDEFRGGCQVFVYL